MSAQVYAPPITMLPAISTARFDGFGAKQHYQRQEEQYSNGIVYVGEELGRTKEMYKSSGMPVKQPCLTGRLVDIYV